MGLGSLFPIAIASGIGQGIGGAGQAIAAEREAQRKREEGQIDLGALAAQGITLPGVPTVGKLPTPMVDVLIKAGATKAAQDREETANRTLAGSLETTFPGAVVSPGHLSAAADLNTLATTPTPLDGPDAAGISERRAQPLPAASRPTPIQVAIDTLRAGSAGKEGRGEAFKGAMEFTKQQREEQVLNDWLARQGGGASPLGVGSSVKAGPLTLNQPAQRPHQVTKDVNGRQIAFTLHPTTGAILGQQDLGPTTPNQGVRNEARAAAVLKSRGIMQGTPEWDEGMYILTNPTPTVPDVGIFSRLDVLGSLGKQSPKPVEPTPRLPVDKRLTPEEAGSLGVTYGTKRSEAEGTKPLLAAQRTKMDAQASVLAMIDKLEKDLSAVSQPSGALGRALGTPGAMLGVYGQTDAQRAALHSRIGGTLALVVRSLGEVGTLNEGDIRRAQSLQPVLAPIPDSAEVTAAKIQGLRELVQEVASRTGSRLDQPARPQKANTPPAAAGWKIELEKK